MARDGLQGEVAARLGSYRCQFLVAQRATVRRR